MVWIRNLLVPNRYDCLCLAIGLMGLIAFCTAGWAVAFSNPTFDTAAFLLGAVAISFFVIGAVVALDRHSPRRVGIMFLIGVLLPPISMFGYWFLLKNPQLQHCLLPAPELMFGRPTRIRPDREMFGWIYCGLVLIPVGSWILFSSVHVGSTRLKRFLIERCNITRTRILIAVAGTLLVVGLIGNILRATSSRYSEDFMRVFLGVVGTLLLSAAIVAITYLPTRFLLGRWARWIKITLSLMVLGLFALGLWASFLAGLPGPIGQHEELIGVMVAIAALAFYFLCIASVAAVRNEVDQEQGLDARQPDHSRNNWRLPSLWGWVVLLVIGGLFWFPFRYDVGMLAATQDWELARQESRLRWSTKGQIRRTNAWGGILFCNFDDSSPPDIFSQLNDDSGSVFVISGKAPQVDYRLIGPRPVPVSAQFDEGTITAEQLNDFLAQPATFVRFGGCSVAESEFKISPHSIDQLYFVSINQRDSQFAEIMAQFESFETVAIILIQIDITSDDWDQIVRASKQTLIRVNGEKPIGLSDNQMAAANRNIVFAGNFIEQDQEKLTAQQWRWLIQSNIVFDLYWNRELANWNQTDSHSQLVQDLVFAFPRRFQLHPVESSTPHLDLSASKENDFVFARDSQGNPTGLWLPFGESNRSLSGLDKLTTLSFDETWLQPQASQLNDRLADLSRLSELQQLSFSAGFMTDETDFLANLKSLKQLQITAVNRSTGGGRGFDSCPSLEQITILGKPDLQSIVEFQRLPNLQQLTIVDLYEEYSVGSQPSNDIIGQEDKGEPLITLQSKLPGVEIEIVDREQFTASIPDAFQRHVETVQARLRKKLQPALSAQSVE